MLSALITHETVFATVGGPTYISAIAHNNDAEQTRIYYQEHRNDGRGCPPIVHQINARTGASAEVKTCDAIFEEYDLLSENESTGRDMYAQFVSDLYHPLLHYMGSVSLEKNNINISVETLSEHDEDGQFWTEFQARIVQDEKELARINFRGCTQEQPHVFEGYMLPNTDILLLLISRKGDCFEGGYVEESVHRITGVTYYDTNIVRPIKEVSASEPNMGNMVVFADALPRVERLDELVSNTEEGAATVSAEDRDRDTRKDVLFLTPFIVIFSLGVGAVLGYVLCRRRVRCQIVGHNHVAEQ